MKNFYQKYKYWLKWIFSLTLIICVFYKVDFNALQDGFKLITWWYYPISILFFILLQLISTKRWKLFLPNNKFKELLKLNFIAQYYAFIIPSSITGDVTKAVQVNKNNNSNSNIISGLIIDRWIGFICLIGIVVVALHYCQVPLFKKFLFPVLLSFVLLTFSFLLLYTPFYVSFLNLISRWPICSSNKINKILLFLSDTVSNMKNYVINYKLLFNVFLYSIIFQLLLAMSYLPLNYIFQFHLSLSDYVLISGITQVLVLLPIGIGGVGIKDVSFVSMMGVLGIASEKVIAATLIGYPIMLLFVFVGWILSLKVTVYET